MSQMITITKNRQITIPAKLFKQLNLREGEKLIVETDGSSLKMRSALKLVRELSGSVKVHPKFKGKSIDEAIEIAKREYFKNKYE